MHPNRFARPERKAVPSTQQLTEAMARADTHQALPVEDSHKFSLAHGESCKYRLGRVTNLDRDAMTDQTSQVDLLGPH